MKTMIVVALLLAGCANLSAEQIKAMEGQAGVLCFQGATWNGSPMSIQYASVGGKATGTAGGGAIAKCGAAEFTYTNEGKVQPAQPPKVTP